MGERRRAARLLVLEPGSILLDGSEMPCIVRNLSELGACLVVQSTYVLPAVFRLVIQDHPKIKKTKMCKVVWRDDTMAGVCFLPST